MIIRTVAQARTQSSLRQAGFTLAELLIVISIIGILTGLVSVNLSSTRARARDAERQNDLKAIQTAIELAQSSRATLPGQGTLNEYRSTAGGNWIPTLAPTYIAQVPADPKNNATFYYSYLLGTGRQQGAYFLETRLEQKIDAPTMTQNPGRDTTNQQSFVTGTYRQDDALYFRVSHGPASST